MKQLFKYLLYFVIFIVLSAAGVIGSELAKIKHPLALLTIPIFFGFVYLNSRRDAADEKEKKNKEAAEIYKSIRELE